MIESQVDIITAKVAERIAERVNARGDKPIEHALEIARPFLVEEITKAAFSARDAGEFIGKGRSPNLTRAQNELHEVVASFKRGDMDDVRIRLMDLGEALGLDIWISRKIRE